jgi:hypothetical protein
MARVGGGYFHRIKKGLWSGNSWEYLHRIMVRVGGNIFIVSKKDCGLVIVGSTIVRVGGGYFSVLVLLN